MKKFLQKIKLKIYRFMPISRAEYFQGLGKIVDVMNGLKIADEQHSQMTLSLLQEIEQLKAENLAVKAPAPVKRKNGDNVSYQ